MVSESPTQLELEAERWQLPIWLVAYRFRGKGDDRPQYS